MSENRFTWGDSVRTMREVEGMRRNWRPGAVGSISGFRKIETEREAVSSSFAIGTIVHTVEFEDGDPAQVPQEALEAID